jgi:hypothetical protein
MSFPYAFGGIFSSHAIVVANICGVERLASVAGESQEAEQILTHRRI